MRRRALFVWPLWLLLASCSIRSLHSAEMIRSDWVRLGPTGGAEFDHAGLAVDPETAEILHFASRGADPTAFGEGGGEGYWRSTDGGTSWEHVADEVGAWINWGRGLAPAPAEPRRLYVGQENPQRCWRSDDRGASWTPVNGSPHHVIDVAVDPHDPDIVWVGTDRAVYRSTDAGEGWTHFGRDNGLPWPGGSFSATAFAIALHPHRPQTAWAGFLYGAPESEWGVYRTDDTGASWQACNEGLPEGLLDGFQRRGVHDLAVAPANPSVLYVALSFDRTLYRSEDGGRSWSPLTSAPLPDRFAAAGAEPVSLAVDPVDPRRLFVGTDQYTVFRSTDGGASFESLGYLFDVEALGDGRVRVTRPDGRVGTGSSVKEAVGHGVSDLARVRLDPDDPSRLLVAAPVGAYRLDVLGPVRTLRLAAAGDDLELTWGAVRSATHYRIYETGDPGRPRAEWLLTGETPELRWTVDGGASAPSRHYQVVACDDLRGEGEW
jgi:photosystem II stability/assembly factor-like uncharacterized protein